MILDSLPPRLRGDVECIAGMFFRKTDEEYKQLVFLFMLTLIATHDSIRIVEDDFEAIDQQTRRSR